MRVFLILPALIATTIAAHSQPLQYYALIKQADSLFLTKQYQQSSNLFSASFALNGGKGFMQDRYKAARSWALADTPDSAFFQLNRIATVAKYADYDELSAEVGFKNLQNDKRWMPLLELVKENQRQVTEREKTYNRPLIKQIDSLAIEDQRWRHKINEALNKGTVIDTLLLKNLSGKMVETDSLLFFPLQRIVQQYGFPNEKLVGQEGSHNFWLLIQHQDKNLQFHEQVLVLMKKEVDNKLASGLDYAYLIDRVKVNSGQLQVYGTQMRVNKEQTSYEPKPVIDPANLNARRKEVGLFSIEEYIQIMNERGGNTIRRK